MPSILKKKILTSVQEPSLKHYHFSKEINAQLKALSYSDNYHAFLAVMSDYFFIALAILLSTYSFYFYPLTLLIIGARQRALATILHEAAHNRAACNKKWNYLLGTVMSGYWIFQSFQAYRRSHVMLHHSFLGTQQDPDYQFYLNSGLYKGMSKKQFLFSQVFMPFLLLKSLPYFIFLFKNRLASFRHHREELPTFIPFWLILSLLLTVLHLWLYFLMFWLIPYFTTFIIIGHFIEIAEHFPLVGTSDHPIEMTRNRFSHALEGFFFSIHHENYHLTHHLRAGIPFWKMREAHLWMMQDRQYRDMNHSFGGIFLSSNSKPALIPALIKGKIALPHPFNASNSK